MAAITSLSEVRAEPRGQLVAQLVGVDQVAVVGRARRCGGAVVEDRLGVLPGIRAGRGVEGVPDRELAVEPRELLLVEDLGDEAEVA